MELFIQQAKKQSAEVLQVDDAAAALPLIKSHWQQTQRNPSGFPIYLSASSPLEKLPWARRGFETRSYKKQLGMKNGASLALAAVAETGSLIVPSSPTNARGINFLIDNHLVFIAASRFFLLLEDAWQALWPQPLAAAAAIHFITGPSRTADIEQTLFLGAQGPKRLWVIVYERI